MRLGKKALAFFTVLLMAFGSGIGQPAAQAASSYSNPSSEFSRSAYTSRLDGKGYWGTRYTNSAFSGSYDFTLQGGTNVWDEHGNNMGFDNLDSPQMQFVSVKSDGDYYLYDMQGGSAQVVPASGDPVFDVSASWPGGLPRIQVSLHETPKCEKSIDNVAVFFSGTAAPGRITLKKTFDGPGGNPSQPFSFTVTGPGKGGAARVVTVSASDAAGKTVKVPYGTYYIKEAVQGGWQFVSFDTSPSDPGTGMDTPDTLKLIVGDPTSEGTKCTNHTAYTVTCHNRRVGSIDLAKAVDGAESGDPAKFSFAVTGPGGYSKSVELTGGGHQALGNLPQGTYRIKELAVAAGYRFMGFTAGTSVTGENAVDVTVGPDSWTVSVTCNNQKLGSLIIAKTDSKSGLPLEGAVFHVSGPDYTGDVTTNGSGHAVLMWLTPGSSYDVTETGPPTGYNIKTPGTMTKTITAGGTALFEFADDPVGDIRIKKADKDTQALLDGAVFEIADNKDFTGAVALPPTSGGYTSLDNVLTGHWWVREVKPPTNYILDPVPENNVKEVDIEFNKTAEVAFADQINEASLLVTKHDKTAPGTIDGVTFKLYDKDPASDGFDPVANLKAWKITAGGGQALFDHLAPGTYWVKETAAPAGYRIDAVAQHVTLAAGGKGSLSFYDYEVGRLKIVKTGGANMAGAEFKVSTDPTDFSGAFTMTTLGDGTALKEDLAVDTYYVRETKPPAGFVVDPSTHEVHIAMNDTLVLTIDNKPDVGSLLVRKTSTVDDKALEGVTFDLMDKDPSDPAFTVGNILYTRLTNSSGEILFTDLPAGKTYWVRETATIDGYSIDKTIVKSATIEFNKVVEIAFANAPVGYVRIVKTDKDNEAKKLDGAVFGVYSDSGCTTLVQTLPATDANGTAVSTELPYGPGYPATYYVKEITPPEDYQSNTETQPVTFTAPGQIVELAFRDTLKPGSLVIRKIDELTLKGLPGAEFKLYSDRAMTKQVGSAATTDANGYARFDNLVPGAYWLKETKAPEDYYLLTDPVPVTVTAGQTEPEPLVLKDKYKHRDPPTGTAEWTILACGAIALAAGGTFLLLARGRRSARAN